MRQPESQRVSNSILTNMCTVEDENRWVCAVMMLRKEKK